MKHYPMRNMNPGVLKDILIKKLKISLFRGIPLVPKVEKQEFLLTRVLRALQLEVIDSVLFPKYKVLNDGSPGRREGKKIS